MILSPLVWIFVATIGILWYFNRKKEIKGKKQIPGPKGYPIVGNALQLGKLQYLKFNEWSKQYGDIYKIWLGNIPVVIISDQKMTKEILSNEPVFAGRPHFEGFDLYEDERLGIVNSEGELWEVHRRFLLRQLRDFGFGKSAMESLIVDEINETLSSFKAKEGTPVKDMKKTLSLAVINSLWTIVGTKRYKHDDPKLVEFVSNTNKVIQDLFESSVGQLIIAIPWLRRIIPDLSGFTKFRKVFDDNRLWFEEFVKEHQKTYDENNIRDFIDVYYSEVKKTTDPNSVFYGGLAERQLVATIADLFFAGSDTTSTTLTWVVLYLCKNPDVQKKLQDEIIFITGNSRQVSVSDRPNMPYALAVIDEVLRCSSIVPQGVQHRAMADKEFQGYFIPKDTLIMPNMYYIHHDPKLWKEPEEFRPERFLSADGKKYCKSENLIPFQIGRRQCVGETLARDTIFLFTCNIFQKFTIGFDPNSAEPGFEPQPNFLLNPYPFSVIMKDRM